MRSAFATFITDVARYDENIYLIVGDVGYGLFDEFKRCFPHRFINAGLMEQSMIGIAAGMALQGLKPWIYAITPFLIERPYEQIKIDIDMNNANVKLVGYDDYPTQGMTHNALKPHITMSVFKNITSYFPRNSIEAAHMLEHMYKKKTPCFIRLMRDNGRQISDNVA